jgi:hypothetical protein
LTPDEEFVDVMTLNKTSVTTKNNKIWAKKHTSLDITALE